MWAAPALERAGDWPVVLFGWLCCLAGLVGGAVSLRRWGLELHAATGPASPAPAGPWRAAGWVVRRVAGLGLAGVIALAAAWGLICLARVAVVSL